MRVYPALYRSVLSRTDAERIHDVVLHQLALWGRYAPTRALLRMLFGPGATTDMNIQAFGLEFAHPLGLAGGFDKDGVAIPAWEALGFSSVEVGTITPQAQPGNERPRLFRLTMDDAFINRMGFPSTGLDRALRNLRAAQHSGGKRVPIGISVGKQKSTPLSDAGRDYQLMLASAQAYGDFFVINISSPNTPELRQLQTRSYLADLLAAAQSNKPLCIKIAPDLSWEEIDMILDLAIEHNVAGIIATNTTIQRDGLRSAPTLRAESGGLSGAPLRARSTEIIRHIYRSRGRRESPVIIGVGGVFNAADIWEKLRAGASLVQAYTGFVYEGPAFVRKCVQGLRQRMQADGISRLADVIGADGG